MFENILETTLLYDLYKNLLTDRQREAMGLYIEENLSLSEIADDFEISRQGVFDALKNAEKSLVEYENKLGLLKVLKRTQNLISEIESIVDAMISDDKQENKYKDRLIDIKRLINEINQ